MSFNRMNKRHKHLRSKHIIVLKRNNFWKVSLLKAIKEFKSLKRFSKSVVSFFISSISPVHFLLLPAYKQMQIYADMHVIKAMRLYTYCICKLNVENIWNISYIPTQVKIETRLVKTPHTNPNPVN